MTNKDAKEIADSIRDHARELVALAEVMDPTPPPRKRRRRRSTPPKATTDGMWSPEDRASDREPAAAER